MPRWIGARLQLEAACFLWFCSISETDGERGRERESGRDTEKERRRDREVDRQTHEVTEEQRDGLSGNADGCCLMYLVSRRFACARYSVRRCAPSLEKIQAIRVRMLFCAPLCAIAGKKTTPEW